MKACRFLSFMAVFAFLSMFFGCTDSGGGDANSSESIRENIAGKTEDGNNVLFFEEGYLDEILVKIDTTEINDTSFSGTAIFKFTNPTDIPNVGDIIVSHPTTNAPHGFLFKVLGVATVDGNTAIAYRLAGIEEAIENGNIEVEVKYDFDEDGNLINITQTEIVDKFDGNGPLQKVMAKPISHTRQATDNVAKKTAKDFNITDNITVKTNSEFSLTFGKSFKVSWFRIKEASIYIRPEMDFDVETTAIGDINTTIIKNLYSYPLPPFCVWFVCFTNSADLDLKIAGNAKVDVLSEISTSLHGRYGFGYSSGRFSLISETTRNNSSNLESSVAGNLQIGALIGAKSLLYGFAGFKVDVGPVFELNGDISFAQVRDFTENGFERDNSKVNFDLLMELGVGIEIPFLNKRWPIGLTRTNLKNSKLLPLFDDPQVTFSSQNTVVNVASAIEKEELGFRVKEHGICVEQTQGDCINGGGNRKVFGRVSEVNAKYHLAATFENINPELIYRIIPFVESGVGTYYDKAITIKPSLVDSRDGQVYNITTIGTQTWMAQNLNYAATKCSGGCFGEDRSTRIEREPNNLSDTEVEANCAIYGRLYGTCALEDDVCPAGWHVPNNEEWQTLFDFVGGSDIAGEKLKATSGWDTNNGTDDYGFAALPGGNYNQSFESGANYSFLGKRGFWWSTISSYVWMRGSDDYYGGASGASSYSNSTMSGYMFSIRCLKGVVIKPPPPVIITGPDLVDPRDEQVYKTVVIGTQTWIAENLNYDVPGSRCYDDDPSQCSIYGKLYDWATAMDIDTSYNRTLWRGSNANHKGICPEGWHIPSKQEWEVLSDYAGADGGNAGKKLKATVDWIVIAGGGPSYSYNYGSGTDDYGFSALGGGKYDNSYQNIRSFGYWWSANDAGEDGYSSSYNSYHLDIGPVHSLQLSSSGYKYAFESVRCLKD